MMYSTNKKHLIANEYGADDLAVMDKALKKSLLYEHIGKCIFVVGEYANDTSEYLQKMFIEAKITVSKFSYDYILDPSEMFKLNGKHVSQFETSNACDFIGQAYYNGEDSQKANHGIIDVPASSLASSILVHLFISAKENVDFTIIAIEDENFFYKIIDKLNLNKLLLIFAGKESIEKRKMPIGFKEIVGFTEREYYDYVSKMFVGDTHVSLVSNQKMKSVYRIFNHTSFFYNSKHYVVPTVSKSASLCASFVIEAGMVLNGMGYATDTYVCYDALSSTVVPLSYSVMSISPLLAFHALKKDETKEDILNSFKTMEDTKVAFFFDPDSYNTISYVCSEMEKKGFTCDKVIYDDRRTVLKQYMRIVEEDKDYAIICIGSRDFVKRASFDISVKFR